MGSLGRTLAGCLGQDQIWEQAQPKLSLCLPGREPGWALVPAVFWLWPALVPSIIHHSPEQGTVRSNLPPPREHCEEKQMLA